VSPPRARILRAADADTVHPLLAPQVPAASHRRIAREEVEAHFAAERIEREARERAEGILAEARLQAVAEGELARDAAREQAQAQAIAQWIAVRRAEDARLHADTERVIGLSVLLAERLVGAALDVDPGRIASLAQGVLAEARGARRATLQAHPLDAQVLRAHLATLGLDSGSVEIRDDPSLARGALRLHTDVGILDAQLAPRLERLAVALRDALADVLADARA
jgi:flagellar biosynthesis/type III secretory pathway protein FliH